MFARHILVCSHSLLRVSLHKYGFWVTIFFHHVLPRCCYIVGLMTLLSIPWHSCSLHMLGCLVAVPMSIIACEICPALSQSLELALCWTYLSFAMGFTNFKWKWVWKRKLKILFCHYYLILKPYVILSTILRFISNFSDQNF